MKRVLTALALGVAALSANAALTFTGGTPVSISAYNPTGTTSVQTAGLEDPTLFSTAGLLSATFLGFEALDNDTFTFDAGAFGTLHNTDAIGTTITRTIGAGMLDFSFIDLTTSQTVRNGIINSNYASFAILGSTVAGVFVPYTAGGLYTYVLGFNDGLRVDADYDDMIIGLNLAPIPEPETYALMLAGLGAIGFIARRRKKYTL